MKRLLLALLLASPATAQTYDPVLTQAGLQGSPTTMVPLNLGDDSTRQVNLTFPFEYYGQTFSTAWVSSNGFVSFGNVGHLCCNGYSLDQAPRNTIYGYWTDLISSGNPYYRLTDTDALFGWYNTSEYGTQNKVSFEIDLSASGAIQITYGAVANTYHQVAAGITGPTADDNIQLFLGTNVSSLSFQSGILSPSQPEPVLNCQTTPDAPECVQTYNPVDVAPDVTAAADVIPQETITVTETPAEEVVAEQTTTEEAVTEEPAAEETATEQTTQEEAVAEETVDDSEKAEAAISETAAEPERLSPDEVLALAAVEPQEDALEAAAEPMAEPPAEASVTALVEAPAETPAETPEEVSAAAPTEVSAETPTEMSADQVAEPVPEVTADALVEAPAEPMAEMPAEVATEAPAADLALPEMSEPLGAAVETQSVVEVTASTFAQSDTQQVVDSVETVETSRPEVVSERIQVDEASQPKRVTPITVADAEQAVTEELHSGMAVAVAEPVRVTVEIAQPQQDDMTGQSSQAVTMELLANSMPETNTAPEMAQMTNGSNDAMVELAVAPAGYGSYSQARIPDAPFYAPKDIYKNRKVPDAYWQLYRMMQSQNTAWSDMVEDQYER